METTSLDFATKKELEDAKQELQKQIKDLDDKIVALREQDNEIQGKVKECNDGIQALKTNVEGLNIKLDTFVAKQTGIVGAIVVIAEVMIRLFDGK